VRVASAVGGLTSRRPPSSGWRPGVGHPALRSGGPDARLRRRLPSALSPRLDLALGDESPSSLARPPAAGRRAAAARAVPADAARDHPLADGVSLLARRATRRADSLSTQNNKTTTQKTTTNNKQTHPNKQHPKKPAETTKNKTKQQEQTNKLTKKTTTAHTKTKRTKHQTKTNNTKQTKNKKKTTKQRGEKEERSARRVARRSETSHRLRRGWSAGSPALLLAQQRLDVPPGSVARL